MRHAIANALYSLAARIDREVVRWDYSGVGGGLSADIGDKYEAHQLDDPRLTSASLSVHMRDDTPVSADFAPSSSYTYTALKIGRGNVSTFFLTRRSTQRLITVLNAIDAQYRRVGENRAGE